VAYRVSQDQIPLSGSMCWENVPPDYGVLKVHTLPKSGGDTLFASGYDLYNKLSPKTRTYLEGLTATFVQSGYQGMAKQGNFDLFQGPRGSPENIGDLLKAIHTVHNSVQQRLTIGGPHQSSYGLEIYICSRRTSKHYQRTLPGRVGGDIESLVRLACTQSRYSGSFPMDERCGSNLG